VSLGLATALTTASLRTHREQRIRGARSRRLYLFGALVDTHPVTQALAVACIVAWRLYRGSTPVEEFRRFLNGKAPYASAGLRPNNRWRGP
jgi:hypothetical protein